MSAAATASHSVSSLRPTNPVPEEEKKCESSVFTVIESIIKENAKNVLRTIRQAFEWLRLTFENLKDSLSIANLITFIKIGESTFAFGDFARSIMKIGHNATSFVKIGVAKTISSFAENTLDLMWNVFKLFKALKNPIFPIFSLASKVFIPLQVVGGGCFALSSANRIYKNVKRGNESINRVNANPARDLKTLQKNDATIFARVFETAKNICTIVIGTMLTIGAINGFVAPGLVYLTLGTSILISEIMSSTLQASFRFTL